MVSVRVVGRQPDVRHRLAERDAAAEAALALELDERAARPAEAVELRARTRRHGRLPSAPREARRPGRAVARRGLVEVAAVAPVVVVVHCGRHVV